jgi:predicted SprT family Zn-dependent metalloprotease
MTTEHVARIIHEVVEDIAARYPQYPKPEVRLGIERQSGAMAYYPFLNMIGTSALTEWALTNDERYIRLTVAHEMGHWHHKYADPFDHKNASLQAYQLMNSGVIRDNHTYHQLHVEKVADEFAYNYIGDWTDIVPQLEAHQEALQRYYSNA